MRPRLNITKLSVIGLFVLGGLGVAAVSGPGGGSARATGVSRGRGFRPRIPEGIPEGRWRELVPADNPVTEEKVELGRSLFFDKRLSADGTVSCATCHDPAAAFADHNAVAVGVAGRAGTRNAPTVLNAAFNPHQFWDGHARSLEEQARQPLVNPFEMGMQSHAAVVARVAAAPEYRQAFRRAFAGEGVTIDTIAKAIASFERTQLSGDSPFDRFAAGDESALGDAQKRGLELFRGKARCVECHAFSPASPFFTDFLFHNTGVAAPDVNLEGLGRRARQLKARGAGAPGRLARAEGFAELGRYLVTGRAEDVAAFKTPTLRDVELTAPYMHDGSRKTLLDVVRFYSGGGGPNPNLDGRIRPLGLTEAEMGDLVEFLRALTSDEVLRQVQNARPQTRTPAALPPSATR